MKKYKNINNFLILVIIFIIPFFIKSIDYRLELFPAVILPAGSYMCNIEKEVSINKNEIYGIDYNGKQKKLDKEIFMGKVRMEYFNYFYKNHFGLIEYEPKKQKTLHLNFTYNIKSKISKNDIIETKKWLQKKLKDQNCIDSVLILKNHRIVILKDGSYYEDKLIKNDTILNIY